MQMRMLLPLAAAVLCGCATVSDGPRQVLSLETGEGNPRNGEGDFAKLRDGRILLVYTAYNGTTNTDDVCAHLVKRVSSDGGESWSDPVEAVPRLGKLNDMSVSLLRMGDGRLGLFYLRKDSTNDCLPVARYSTDEGANWSAPVECLPTGERGYYVLNNARAVRLKSGRIVLPLARHSSASPEGFEFGRLSCVYSDDDGLTWRKGREHLPVDADGKPVCVQEPGVIELKDGRIYLYARTDRGRQWQGFSADGGETFGEFGPSPIFGPRGPATIRRLPDGRLLLVWNDHEGHPEYAKMGAAWLKGQRAPLTIAYSSDEGRTWPDRQTVEAEVEDGFFCYFAALVEGGDLLLHYYNRPHLSSSCVTKVPLRLGPDRTVYPPEYHRLLADLVAIPSESSDIPAVNRAVACMKDFLERHGVACVTDETEEGRLTLYASTRPGKVQDYLLNAHLDVVAAPPEMFRLTAADGRYFGRGVGDCKGSCVALAKLLVDLNGMASVGVAFSTDEEIGGDTATFMVGKGYGARKMVVIVDGGAGRIVYAQKGVTAFRVIAHGRGGHSASPWLRDNPIDKLVEGYARFRAAWPKAERPDHWEDFCTATMISCDSKASNRIPDEAEMSLNLRFVTPDGADKAERLLRETTGCEVVRYKGFRPPFAFSPDHPEIVRLQKRMQAAWPGRTIAMERNMAAGDANHFAPLGVPVPTVGIVHGNSHGSGEWFSASSALEFVKMMEDFILTGK